MTTTSVRDWPVRARLKCTGSLGADVSHCGCTAPTRCLDNREEGVRVDSQHERAPTAPRRSERLGWFGTALQVIQTVAILIRTWHDL